MTTILQYRTSQIENSPGPLTLEQDVYVLEACKANRAFFVLNSKNFAKIRVGLRTLPPQDLTRRTTPSSTSMKRGEEPTIRATILTAKFTKFTAVFVRSSRNFQKTGGGAMLVAPTHLSPRILDTVGQLKEDFTESYWIEINFPVLLSSTCNPMKSYSARLFGRPEGMYRWHHTPQCTNCNNSWFQWTLSVS